MGKLRRLRNRTLAIATLFCLIAIILPISAFAADTFTDISNHWGKDKIESWIDKGFVSGYPDGSFKPDQEITRAEFMAIVNSAFSFTMTEPTNYLDVDNGAWYAHNLAVAKAGGYIKGYPDGTMRPNNPISREEAAAIIMRLNNLIDNEAAASQFADAADTNWSKGAVGAVADAGIMQGYLDGTFQPQGFITRAEAVVALDGAINYAVTVPVVPEAPVTPDAPQVTRNDSANTVSGMTTDMEYQLDDGDWVKYTHSTFDELDFSGKHTLLVRFAAAGNNPFGPSTKLTFTTNISSSYGGSDSDSDSIVEVSAITVIPTTMTLIEGGATGTITVTVAPSNATNKSVTWSSSDTNVASVDSSGTVTSAAAGSATITVTSVADGTKTAICVVTAVKGVDGNLQAAKDDAAALTEADYTVITWTDLISALALPETNDAEKIIKTTAIEEAIAALVPVADMTAYNAALAAVTEADYTTASWAAYQTVVDANVVTDQNSQAEVDAATAAITAAQTDLVMIIPITAIGEITRSGSKWTGTLTAGALTPNDAIATYQWQRWSTGLYWQDVGTGATYSLAIGDNANRIFRVIATGSENFIGSVTSAEFTNSEADMTAYNAALAAVTEADYTTASWAAYQAVVDANTVTNLNTQADVDAATAAITAAQAGLVEAADMTAYNAALAAVAEADYTTASWAAYQAVVDANAVTDQNTQAEVDAATAAITAAQAGLVEAADMTAYNAALAAVAEADYTTASWAAYQAVVDANAVTDQNSQAEVDAATAAITAAQADLVMKTPITAIEAITRSGSMWTGALTAGALTPNDATATYQWQRWSTGLYWQDVGTGETYSLAIGDNANRLFRVIATGTGDFTDSVTSAEFNNI
jgi:hypothetical protein